MTHLRLEGLTRRFAGTPHPAVDGVSLELPRGALLALLGPSGCGKTTTLRMIAGLEVPDTGRVVVADRDVTALPPHRRNMGVVFQSYALFPHMTAAANVAFGLEMRGIPRAERQARVAEALDLVGLRDYAARKPSKLSGGQQQRVALARALAIRPDLLLLDEPLSALDAKLREGVRDEIRALQQRVGATTVFVTHDQTEALAMADLVAVMNEGRVEQLGTPEEVFERPATRFVATFVGRAARLPGKVEAPGVVHCGAVAVKAAATPAPGASVELFIRPHHIRPLAEGHSADNALDAQVLRRTFTGDVVALECATPAGTLTAELHGGTPGASAAVGSRLRLGFAAQDVRVFPA
ncbi:spermidine/putrescine ABC transporter ATP-binding protein [Falsiroseomonas bella]|uniref:Spermidine/putrescine ABC transporter ATP-binding protein n=1 Tax=Falsiroseomonas bella TaxID=2184016 RepID=A0A317FJT5_9PROT|nr:ABC transporter ATP-binding protein [Falsiroseomonas bella]PWS39260.1 spermidine/putrescine ABC transporter ATP-binding protein [Falsiroseomonas bella]